MMKFKPLDQNITVENALKLYDELHITYEINDGKIESVILGANEASNVEKRY